MSNLSAPPAGAHLGSSTKWSTPKVDDLEGRFFLDWRSGADKLRKEKGDRYHTFRGEALEMRKAKSL